MIVSVIIPSFEQGQFIENSIKSVLEQSSDSFEVFVLDANSKDQTKEILEKYSHNISAVVEEDLGQTHAINKGLMKCKGEIVGYLNSDDVLLPGTIEKVVECFRGNRELDLLYGRAHYIDENGEIVGDYKTKSWDFDRFRGECFICQPATFWSRRIMERIGLLDQKLHCSMDYDYWLRIAQAGGVIKHIDEYLACSRDYPQTKTRSLRGRVFIENFKISLKRLGFVHSFWISQYMDYFKYERQPIWAKLIPPAGTIRDRITGLLQNLSYVWARDVYFKEPPHGPVV